MEGILNLTAYSILAQAGVGMAVLLFIAMMLMDYHEENRHRFLCGYFLAVILTAAAMLVSMTHLGSPLRAPNAILHLGSSWLSREIFFNGAFFGCAAAVFAFIWLDCRSWKGVEALKKITILERLVSNQGIRLFAALSLITGLLCIISQASIYANAVMPAWQHGHAYVSFIGATLAIGSSLTALLFWHEDASRKGCLPFFITAAVLLICSIISQGTEYGVLAGGLSEAGRWGAASLLLLEDNLPKIVVSFLFLTIGLLGIICQFHRQKAGSLLYAMAILILAGEILNRVIFYGIGVPINL